MSKTLAEIQNGSSAIMNHSTYENYRSILNKINKHYGWERDVIHYDLLQEHAMELPALCCELWQINSTSALQQKIASIGSLVTRSLGSSDHRIKKLINTIPKEHSIQAQLKVRNIPDWKELQAKLASYSKEDSVRGIIALAFSHGYVLRIGEMFDTKVRVDDGVHNYLDPDNLTWTIRMHKNGADGDVREFKLNKEFITALPIKAGWLIGKKDGTPYGAPSSRTLKYHKWWADLPSNRDIRASFETWNLHSERPKQDSMLGHEILGHTKTTAETYYDQTLMSAPKKIRPIIKKRNF